MTTHFHTTAMALFLSLATTASANTLYVDDNAPNDPGPGDPTISDPLEDGSATHPFDAIQEAIDAAVAGDEVVLADGTYTGVGNKDLDFGGKAITVRSASGDPETCVIDCEGAGRGFYFHSGEGTDSVLKGITVTHGQETLAGAIRCYREVNPLIVDCMFTNNTANYGGALWNYRSNPTLVNCVFLGNSALAMGGAFYNHMNSCPTLLNCTFSGNADGGAAGALYNSNSNPTLVNCVLWGDTPCEIGNSVASTPLLTYCCIQGGTGETWFGEGCINEDPLFESDTDLRITFASPCVDTGTNTPSGGLPEYDLDGNPRLSDGDGDGTATVDMGAYEYIPGILIATTPDALCFEGVAGLENPASQTLLIWNRGIGTLNWEITDQPAWLTVSPVSGTSQGATETVALSPEITGLLPGEHLGTIQIRDPEADNSPVEIPITLLLGDPLLVPSEFPTIQAAIDIAVDGDTVAIADGTYTGIGNKNLDFTGKAITVRSISGDPALCMIDCEGEGRGFHFHSGEGPNSIVTGLTIENGRVDRSTPDSDGGAVRCVQSNPALCTCVFRNNHALHCGGGIYCYEGGPMLSNCVFTKNIACESGAGLFCVNSDAILSNCIVGENAAEMYGGGIVCNESTAMITGCTFMGNVAANGAGLSASSDASSAINCTFARNIAGAYGGGSFLDNYASTSFANCEFLGNVAGHGGGATLCGYQADPTFVNCTMSENRATWGGAIQYWGWGNPSFSNCIVWNNTPTSLPVAEGSPDPIVKYSCIEDGAGTPWFGEGCIDENPQFASRTDFHLTTGSPCIDAGTNTPAGGLRDDDIDGHSRVIDGDGDTIAIVDMGAYELIPTAPLIALSPEAFECETLEGGANPEDQILSIHNGGAGTLNWTITGQPTWLTVAPVSGVSTEEAVEVTLSVSADGLSHGQYAGILRVTDPLASNSPVCVHVTLRVSATSPLLVPSEYATIQMAIDAAVDGDVVEIADGTHTGAGNKNLDFRGKAITVRSASGDPYSCVLDCEGEGRGFCFRHAETTDSVVEGLTVTNGSATRGGAIFLCGASPAINSCVIRNCRSDTSGGGVYSWNSSSTLVNCSILGNTADENGGAIDVLDGSELVLTNCDLSNNVASGSGGAVSVSWCNSTHLTNCTIAGNTALSSGGGLYAERVYDVTIENCLLWWNTPDQIAEDDDGTLDEASSLTQPTWDNWSPTNRYPMLTSDGHLTTFSDLCFDTGDNALLPADTFDLDGDGDTTEPIPFDVDGDPRVVDSGVDGDPTATVDIGADEFVDTDGDGLPDWWEKRYFGDPLAANPGDDPDSDGLSNLDEYEDFSTDPLADPIFVHPAGGETPDGTQENPFPTILQALNVAEEGDTVIVAPGHSYSGAGNLPLDFHNRRIVLHAYDPNDPGSGERATLSCDDIIKEAVVMDSVRGTGQP